MQEINNILSKGSLIALSILIMPGLYKIWGDIARYLLIIIVFSRPLANLFPQIKLFGRIVSIRKGLGIFCGSSALAHTIGYFIFNEIPIGQIITNSIYWSFSSPLGRGMLAMITMLIPYLTSNYFSMRKLKTYRKKAQRFTYLAFVATAIHIYLIQDNPVVLGIVALYSIIYILAYKKAQGITKN